MGIMLSEGSKTRQECEACGSVVIIEGSERMADDVWCCPYCGITLLHPWPEDVDEMLDKVEAKIAEYRKARVSKSELWYACRNLIESLELTRMREIEPADEFRKIPKKDLSKEEIEEGRTWFMFKGERFVFKKEGSRWTLWTNKKCCSRRFASIKEEQQYIRDHWKWIV